MELADILSGDQLTGRQAAMIFFAWISLVLTAGFVILLVTQGSI